MHLALLAMQDNKLKHSQDFLHTIWSICLVYLLEFCVPLVKETQSFLAGIRVKLYSVAKSPSLA